MGSGGRCSRSSTGSSSTRSTWSPVSPSSTRERRGRTTTIPRLRSSTARIEVDLNGSMSGLNAALGNWAWDGVKLAVDQANAKGGVSGRKIDLQQLDDQGQPTVATDLAQRAISDHVVMVYGSNLSSVSL